MALKKIVHDIRSMFESPSKGKNSKYNSYINAALLVGILVVAGWYGYTWYQKYQEESAFKLFEQNVEEFERVTQEGKQADWANIELLFKLGHDQYSRSSLAPYFLVYQAQAMKKQGKHDTQVIELLDKAITAMGSASSLQPMFKVKVALMYLDMAEQENVTKGIEALRAVSENKNSTGYDIAAYYLGLYYWTHDNAAKATPIWQELIDSQKNIAKVGQSPWAN